jgi:CRISPR-associated protein Csx16
MTNFINLVDWSSALQVFIRTGHGSQLGTLAERQARDLRKSGHQDATVLINLANSLTAFSQNIATVRVPDIITGSDSVVGSAKNVLKCIEFSEETVKDYFLPLVSLIELLKVQLKPLVADSLFSPIGMLAMLNLAKMYVDYERYPEAAVVIREGWVSLYADSTQTDSFLLNRQQREKIEDFWRQAELHQLGGTGEADFLSNIRNDIQHGGFRPNSLSAKSLIKNINKLIMDFSKKLEISSNKIF